MLFPMNRRKIFLAIVWMVLAVNFVYFFRRSLMSDYCNVDQLIKKSSSKSGVLVETNGGTDRLREYGTTEIREASVSNKAEKEVNADNVDERCETMEGQLFTTAAVADGDSDGQRPPWCMYKDQVDLRIIVLTFKRHESLLKLLK